MEGLIIKIISNQCFVKYDKEVIVCSFRGNLRRATMLPLVGDRVIFDKDKKVVTKVLERKTEIRRPPVANISQAIIVTSLVCPAFSTNLIDKLIIELEFNNIKPFICLTKKDLISDKEYSIIKNDINYYEKIGYKVFDNNDLNEIKKIFKDNITVLIGQTGAGKSTLLNRLVPELNLKTGEVSEALGRGRHTTRHVEIYELFDGMLLDTPGFSSLDFDNMTKEEVRDSFIEFRNFPCLYRDCLHLNESECLVKKAVNEGKIAKFRYENYCSLVETALDNKDKYKRK
ncbi:MAG: ribosome small subunit-dependent GTPase A [Bacilli bacterium]|nr:ribosome small subunit-dependent GTPase A [Bacilli bacterium]